MASGVGVYFIICLIVYILKIEIYKKEKKSSQMLCALCEIGEGD